MGTNSSMVAIKSFPLDQIRVALFDDESEIFKVVDGGTWKDQGKWAEREVVFEELATGHYYTFFQTRRGDWYSGYEFQWEEYDESIELERVQKVERIVYVWEPVEMEGDDVS